MPRKLTPDQKKYAVRLIFNGHSYDEVAKRYRVGTVFLKEQIADLEKADRVKQMYASLISNPKFTL